MVDPQEIEQLVNTAMQLDRAGQVDDAIVAYETVLRQFPNLPDCWYNLGVLQRRRYRFSAALAAYDQALAFAIRAPEEVHLNRAVIYADFLQRPLDAEQELQTALRKNPTYVPALFNLANLAEDLGRRDQAVELYQRVLALDPLAYEALARYAQLQSANGHQQALVGRLQAALGNPAATVADRASLGFALGKLLDASGEYDAAFAAYRSANLDSRTSAPPGTPPYNAAAEAAYFERIVATFDRDDKATVNLARSARPIFICGMFRSGSTLAERVIAGHPLVRAGGELPLLPGLVSADVSPYPEAARDLTGAMLASLAKKYLDQLAQLFPDGNHVTDKRPDNFLRIGLIKKLFPQAKIVHTVRNPLDVCLSIYFLHLDQSMNYAFELADIAQHYRNYQRLMAHWQALYGADILQLDYDAFVSDPRASAVRLLKFCGLSWDERCLAIDRQGGAVKTASVWQVREPLYQHSSGRWRHYERHLGVLRAALGDLAPA